MKYKRNPTLKEKTENRYIFACCLKGVSEPGEFAYPHLTREEYEQGDNDMLKI